MFTILIFLKAVTVAWICAESQTFKIFWFFFKQRTILNKSYFNTVGEKMRGKNCVKLMVEGEDRRQTEPGCKRSAEKSTAPPHPRKLSSKPTLEG